MASTFGLLRVFSSNCHRAPDASEVFMKRLPSFVLLSVLLAGAAWAQQLEQRHKFPRPPEKLNTFDELKTEAEESAAVKARSAHMAEQVRNSAMADLHQQLPLLIQQAQALQNQLRQTDLHAKLPADLSK